ncbi:hypothetical protein BD779DRAFT_1564556 [Infundibulicybe gibba]|nr:hypothetical protein BD779DRAFT_1564556 [Infundibulicybe gibba]
MPISTRCDYKGGKACRNCIKRGSASTCPGGVQSFPPPSDVLAAFLKCSQEDRAWIASFGPRDHRNNSVDPDQYGPAQLSVGDGALLSASSQLPPQVPPSFRYIPPSNRRREQGPARPLANIFYPMPSSISSHCYCNHPSLFPTERKCRYPLISTLD